MLRDGSINLETIQNHGDVLALERQLLSITNDVGQFLVKDVSPFYYFASDPTSGLELCILNFSDYSTFFDSSELSRFDPTLQEALKTIIQFNNITTRNQTAILKVSQDFNPTVIKEQLLGKTRTYGLRIYDSTTQHYTTNYLSTLSLCHSQQVSNSGNPCNLIGYDRA